MSRHTNYPVMQGDGAAVGAHLFAAAMVTGAPVRFQSAHPVEPAAGSWSMAQPPDPRSLPLAPPPPNPSLVTQAELAELQFLTHRRTPTDVQQILRWEVYASSVTSNWEALAIQLTRRYQLSPPAAARVQHALSAAIYCALVAAWSHKYRYLRPRPNTLDPAIDVSVVPVPQHPAYPAGHSTVAGAASAVLRQFFPAEAALANLLAEDAGMSRLKAGVHYRSDHTAGLDLGRRAAQSVLASMARDGGPLSFQRPPGAAPLTFPQLLSIIDCQNRCHLPQPQG